MRSIRCRGSPDGLSLVASTCIGPSASGLAKRSIAERWVELEYRGIEVAQHVRYEVRHRAVLVGTYEADLVAEQAVIVETKTGLVPDPSAPGQLLSYLSAARLPVGLILHFGPRADVKRMVRSEYVALERRGRPISGRGDADPR